MKVSARRAFFALFVWLAGCTLARGPVTDISGAMPPLSFAMQRANDGAQVTEQDYRGDAVILYFGYTNCPDVCPTTLTDLSTALSLLGARARDVRVLFITVDPARDTAPALKAYVRAFAPEIDGLRGSADAIARLARRYRVTYEVTPASPAHAYEVMHSASVFFFDRDGRARYVATSVANAPLIAGYIAGLLR